jgi:hypothetical protein
LNATALKSLRPYQAHLIADVCRAGGPVLVEQPTGSGKTMQIVTLVAMQLGERFTHAVIAAPQQQIEHAFVHPDYRLVTFPACQGVAAPDIEVPEGLILGARNSKQLNSASRLIAYLRHRGSQDYSLACTHAALNRLSPERARTPRGIWVYHRPSSRRVTQAEMVNPGRRAAAAKAKWTSSSSPVNPTSSSVGRTTS